MNINNILLDLEIIKQINKNDKLGIYILPGKKQLYVDYSSYFSSIKRLYNNNNRNDTINYLYDLFDNIQKASITIIEGTHTDIGINLKYSINKAIPGLENLKESYVYDSCIIGKINLLIKNLVDICNTLEKFFNPTLETLNIIENNIEPTN